MKEGRIELRQAAGLPTMFRLGGDSAREAGDGLAPHRMGPDQMLGDVGEDGEPRFGDGDAAAHSDPAPPG